MPNLDVIRNLIGEGNLKEALARLLTLLDSSDRKTRKLRDGVIVLNSKFKDLSHKETLGLMDADDVLREKAQINDALLNIIGDMESEASSPTAHTPATTPSKKWWWLLLLLIPVGLVAVFWGDLNPEPKQPPQQDPPPTGVPRRATISFAESAFDFGTVLEGNTISHTFGFQNTGNAPLLLSEVSGSPGYTIQYWRRDSVPPGGHGEIMVVFNTQGKTGAQQGQITARGNMDASPTTLTIRGVVVRQEITTPKPIARFQVENNGCEAPCKLRFINSSVNAVSYKWEFGDGHIDLGRSPEHQYAKPGDYIVTLRVNSPEGISNFARKAVTINAVKQPPSGGDASASWGWKRVTQANMDDANNFLNGAGAYTRKVKQAEIVPAPGSTSDFIIFYQAGTSPGWAWKRVANLNLDDAHQFMNGTGTYSQKIANAEIFSIQRGGQKDLILFYQPGSSQGWGWKRVTNLNLNDAVNFLNGSGGYNHTIKNAEIVAIQEGSRTDLIVFYQRGQSATSGQWKQTSVNDNNALQALLGTTKEAEVITVGNKYIVFYK